MTGLKSKRSVRMGDRVYLRALDSSDLDNCHRWHNDGVIYGALVDPFRFISNDAEKSWLERRTRYSIDEISLAICVRGSSRHVGNIYLRKIDWISRNARLGIFIGEKEERSKGYGTSAIHQLLSYAFNDLGLKRICLTVLADNQTAVNVYNRCGFSIEGTLRNHVFKQGIWKDLIVMGICTEDQVRDEAESGI